MNRDYNHITDVARWFRANIVAVFGVLGIACFWLAFFLVLFYGWSR